MAPNRPNPRPPAVQGQTTRAYGWASGQHLATSGAAAVRSTAVAAVEVCLCATVAGYVKVGDNTVTASAGAGSLHLPAGLPFHMQIFSGQQVSFIRAGSTDGALSLLPVL